MKSIRIVVFIFWLILVILWNYGFPLASPFFDVLIAILLAGIQFLVLKFFNNK
tara:strand:+ start:4620 stop:4778 length:159 start_codon:yes stop_codon:yes gene_type:complete